MIDHYFLFCFAQNGAESKRSVAVLLQTVVGLIYLDFFKVIVFLACAWNEPDEWVRDERQRHRREAFNSERSSCCRGPVNRGPSRRHAFYSTRFVFLFFSYLILLVSLRFKRVWRYLKRVNQLRLAALDLPPPSLSLFLSLFLSLLNNKRKMLNSREGETDESKQYISTKGSKSSVHAQSVRTRKSQQPFTFACRHPSVPSFLSLHISSLF